MDYSVKITFFLFPYDVIYELLLLLISSLQKSWGYVQIDVKTEFLIIHHRSPGVTRDNQNIILVQRKYLRENTIFVIAYLKAFYF